MKTSTTLWLVFLAVGLTACKDTSKHVRELALKHEVQAVQPLPARPPARVELGRKLFFDPILSGNKDLSCATCHHPQHATADGRALPIGTGGTGLGPKRVPGNNRELVPRNSPDLFHRADATIHTMFWDLRIEAGPDGKIISPAGGLLPSHARTMFAAQAMFPVIARQEMRGERSDPDNEIGALFDSQPQEIWTALMDRILAVPEYAQDLGQAFPDVPHESLNFEHVALALADFQADAFHPVDAPWDRFLRGEAPLNPDALRGAALFFDVGCANCHSGNLLTDQRAHNLAVPPIGPGKEPFKPLDLGFQTVSGNPKDAFAFRTPPLRNVEKTAPYMHNGAIGTLEQAIQHHAEPQKTWSTAAMTHLPGNASIPLHIDDVTRQRVFQTWPGPATRPLSPKEVEALVAFLKSLTSPSLDQLHTLVPKTVPSGLAQR